MANAWILTTRPQLNPTTLHQEQTPDATDVISSTLQPSSGCLIPINKEFLIKNFLPMLSVLKKEQKEILIHYIIELSCHPNKTKEDLDSILSGINNGTKELFQSILQSTKVSEAQNHNIDDDAAQNLLVILSLYIADTEQCKQKQRNFKSCEYHKLIGQIVNDTIKGVATKFNLGQEYPNIELQDFDHDYRYYRLVGKSYENIMVLIPFRCANPEVSHYFIETASEYIAKQLPSLDAPQKIAAELIAKKFSPNNISSLIKLRGYPASTIAQISLELEKLSIEIMINNPTGLSSWQDVIDLLVKNNLNFNYFCICLSKEDFKAGINYLLSGRLQPHVITEIILIMQNMTIENLAKELEKAEFGLEIMGFDTRQGVEEHRSLKLIRSGREEIINPPPPPPPDFGPTTTDCLDSSIEDNA